MIAFIIRFVAEGGVEQKHDTQDECSMNNGEPKRPQSLQGKGGKPWAEDHVNNILGTPRLSACYKKKCFLPK